MEIRAATISFSKNLANCREMEIIRRLQALDELFHIYFTLDEFICNNFHVPDIDQVLRLQYTFRSTIFFKFRFSG